MMTTRQSSSVFPTPRYRQRPRRESRRRSRSPSPREAMDPAAAAAHYAEEAPRTAPSHSKSRSMSRSRSRSRSWAGRKSGGRWRSRGALSLLWMWRRGSFFFWFYKRIFVPPSPVPAGIKTLVGVSDCSLLPIKCLYSVTDSVCSLLQQLFFAPTFSIRSR